MELIGQTIDARPAPSVAAWIFTACAGALLAIAVATGDINWSMGAVFPVFVAAVSWFRRPKRLVFAIEPRGLTPMDGGETIAFDSISEVTVNGAAWNPEADPILRAPLRIHHTRGTLTIPPRLNVPPAAFHMFLQQHSPSPLHRECPPVLASFLADHASKFGAGQVHVIHCRRRFHAMPRWKALFTLALALIATGTTWLLIAGFRKNWFPDLENRDGWIIGGIVALFVGVPFWILAAWSSTASSKTLKAAKGACLIVTPAGMAMIQGDLKGAMRWDEVLKVQHAPGASAIAVSVPGCKLMILNVYERSLDEIAMLIRRRLG